MTSRTRARQPMRATTPTHFKKKHRKRRVCTPELAKTVSRSICASPIDQASVYVASDVLDVAEEMRERFAAREELRLEGDYDADGWLCASPLQVQTERERAVLAGRFTPHGVYGALVPASHD